MTDTYPVIDEISPMTPAHYEYLAARAASCKPGHCYCGRRLVLDRGICPKTLRQPYWCEAVDASGVTRMRRWSHLRADFTQLIMTSMLKKRAALRREITEWRRKEASKQ